MASTVSLYKGPMLIGTGSASAGSTSITGYTDAVTGKLKANGRRLAITVTQAGTHVGRTWVTRVLADNGAGTLTLRDACPFVGA